MEGVEERRDSGAEYTNARIREWLKASADERSFFIFVNYMETHELYLPPYPFNRNSSGGRFNPWRVVRSVGRRDEILAQQVAGGRKTWRSWKASTTERSPMRASA